MSVETVTSETLAEFNAARMPSAFEQAEIKAKEIEEANKPKTEEGEDEHKEKPKKGNPKIEQRFSELTAKNREASERAAAAEARAIAAEARAKELEEASKPKAKEKDDGPGARPDPKDFTDAFDFAEALSDWKVKAAFHEKDQKDAKERADQERAKTLKAWQERLDLTKTEIPDFEEMVASSSLQVSDVVRDTLIESEFGPKLLYHFASDEAAAEKLNAMTVKQALMHIAKLEAKYEAAVAPKEEKETKVEAKEEKPKPKPPAPITPIRASTQNVANPDELSYEQWKAQRRAGKI